MVIPTIWKSNRIIKLVDDLTKCHLVDEIIIIDNNPKDKKNLNKDKLIFIEQSINIFVNKAWNIGVQNSKNNLICISNDDINFDIDIFDFIHKNQEKLGCIGIHPDSYKKSSEEFKIKNGHNIGSGWGCLIFLKKENWKLIPDKIKILYGDDWISINNEPVHSIVTKSKIQTEMSTTSSKKEFKIICNADKSIWPEIISEWILYGDSKKCSRNFLVQYEDDEYQKSLLHFFRNIEGKSL